MILTNQSRLQIIDVIYLISAIYILVHHAQFLTWQPQLSYLGFDQCHWLSLCRLFLFGRQALLLFFVLSGFVIDYTYGSKKNFSTKAFIRRRIVRLVPQLSIALAVTFILDKLAINLRLLPYINGSLYPELNTLAQAAHNSFFENISLVFLEAKWPIWGSNHPLWMLRYQILCYLLYPCIKRFIRHTGMMTVIVGFCLSVVITSELSTFTKELCIFASCWITGAILSQFFRQHKYQSLKLLSVLVVLLPILYLRPNQILSNLSSQTHDLLWLFVWVGVVSFSLTHQHKLAYPILIKLASTSSISYSLYLIHYPLMLFISGIYVTYISNLLPPHVGLLLVSCAVSLVTSTVMAKLRWQRIFKIPKYGHDPNGQSN